MRITLRSLLLILLLQSVWLPAEGAAQALPAVGSRIRISHIDGRVITGTIRESSAEAVTVLTEPNQIRVLVPFPDIQTLEWNYRGKPRFAKYVTISVLSIGAVVGTAAALMTANECSGGLLCSPAENFAIGAMVGGMIGIPVGIIAGLSGREQGWLTIGLPESNRVALSVGPSFRRPGGVVGAISVRSR